MGDKAMCIVQTHEQTSSCQIGEVLCQFEVEKKMAIEREDYDTAKERKVLQM